MPLPVEVADLPDLTNAIRRDRPKEFAGMGSFGTVYRCEHIRGHQVAVKVINFPLVLSQADRTEFLRKVRRELGIWKRLSHRNIVPLLGTADGEVFVSDHQCMVSMWMSNGTLSEYMDNYGASLSLPSRIQLIEGTATGLQYLHSELIVHGDFHPGNILIDKDYNPRITDFGYSQTLSPQAQLTYLWTKHPRPGAKKWVAPELLHPDLFPDLEGRPTLQADVYSLGCIILFILSGNPPWKTEGFEKEIGQCNSPPHPPWPVFPDVVWDFLERCWSPKLPKSRQSAQDALSFIKHRLKESLQPSSISDINVVIFGAVGCGKSSIVNLLAKESLARVSTTVEPCTKRPRCYRIPIGEKRFMVWDTTGFSLPRRGSINPGLPFSQAHTILCDIPEGVHLILLCASKEEIRSRSTSLRDLYWLVNDVFFGGRAPIALVVTHFDNTDKVEEWWRVNQDIISSKTDIPVEVIPRMCSTTSLKGCEESRHALRSLLENSAASAAPIPLRIKSSSLDAGSLASNCGLSNADANALVNKFSKQQSQFNVVFFGKTGAGKSSIINLIAGREIAPVSSNVEHRTLHSTSHTIDTPTGQFVVWDTMGFNGVRRNHDTNPQAVLHATRLVRDLSAQSGIDLLVFVKDGGKLTTPEQHCYRLLEEFLCEGQVPVAIVVTQLEDNSVMEQWWERNGKDLLKVLRGDIAGHVCITSLPRHDPRDTKFVRKWTESRQKVQDLLEGCFSSHRGEEVSVHAKDGEGVHRNPGQMTIENLKSHCGLTKDLAREVIKLHRETGGG